MHESRAFTSPGRSENVRAAIDTARSARLNELASKLGAIITELPVSGWPTALFARRDALILTLASTGLPYTRIADLRIGDVVADPTGDGMSIDGGFRTRTPRALAAAGTSPSLVLRR